MIKPRTVRFVMHSGSPGGSAIRLDSPVRNDQWLESYWYCCPQAFRTSGVSNVGSMVMARKCQLVGASGGARRLV